jgi:hypothetical protein
MGILLGVSGFRVSGLNCVCVCVCLSVRSISYWLENCPTCDWTKGRKGSEFSLSLINTNEEVSSLSLTHTHTNQEVSSHSLTHWNREVSSHSHTHTKIGRWVLTHTHTLKWGGEFSLTHTLKLGGDFSLTHSNEKVSSQSLTHPCSFTCVNGFTYSSLIIFRLDFVRTFCTTHVDLQLTFL